MQEQEQEQGRRPGTGITLNAFRLNTAVNHVMFGGRRGRVYGRLVALSGVRPGDAVLDVGSSSGYLPAGWRPSPARRAACWGWTRRSPPSPAHGAARCPACPSP